MEMRTCRWLGHSSSISQTFCSTDRPLSSSSTSSSSSSTLANRTHCDFLRQVGPLKMLVRKFGPLEIVGAVNWAHKVTNIIGWLLFWLLPARYWTEWFSNHIEQRSLCVLPSLLWTYCKNVLFGGIRLGFLTSKLKNISRWKIECKN